MGAFVLRYVHVMLDVFKVIRTDYTRFNKLLSETFIVLIHCLVFYFRFECIFRTIWIVIKVLLI